MPTPIGRTDHFLCYKARTARRSDPFEKRTEVRVDQFGQVSLKLVRPALFCNPVSKNGEGIIDPSTHLTCYMKTLLTDIDRKPNQVTATDQFGEWGLDIRTRPANFCVPSLDITGPPAPSAGTSSSALSALLATHIDDYDLYWAKRTPRTPMFEKRGVNLVDQWVDDDVELIKSMRFGTPAKGTQGNADYIDEEAKLTCYSIRKAEKFEKRDVEIENEFGQERLTVTKPHILCVPSEELGDEDEN